MFDTRVVALIVVILWLWPSSLHAQSKVLMEAYRQPHLPPTGFDFTRRDSLNVATRNIPTLLRDTIEWIQSDPFKRGQRLWPTGLPMGRDTVRLVPQFWFRDA